jgi:predicted transcriptional regulator
MGRTLPELSRFELQCLRRLWAHKEATIREIQADFENPPTYSTFRKIFERLEEKGAIERVRLRDRAWVYRSIVTAPAMIQREVRRLVDGLFDGEAAPLVAHLAEMDAISVEDLRAIEEQLGQEDPTDASPGNKRMPARQRSGKRRSRRAP